MANADKVRDIIEKELGVEREKLTDNASFIEDLGADSLDIVELVMEFAKLSALCCRLCAGAAVRSARLKR